MLVILSLVLTIILDSLFARSILRFLNTLIDFSVFQGISSIELLIILIPSFIILPAFGIFLLLRKFNVDQKLQNMQVVKIIFATLLTLFIIYAVIVLLSTMIKGGGATFAIKIIFTKYVLPIMILLFIIAVVMMVRRFIQTRKETYETIPFSKKTIKLFNYLSIVTALAVLMTVFNPYGSILQNFQRNTTFQDLCQNAKTTIYTKIKLESIFLGTDWESSYCNLDNFSNYGSFGGTRLPYPSLIRDTNVTFETINHNKKTSKEFKYAYYDVTNFRNGIGRKSITSKYGYSEKQIYNNNFIIGNSVKIIQLEDNATIAESIYYVSSKTKKVCGELLRVEKFGGNCLKPFYLVLDMIDSTPMLKDKP